MNTIAKNIIIKFIIYRLNKHLLILQIILGQSICIGILNLLYALLIAQLCLY
jgi:hypothetical protein